MSTPFDSLATARRLEATGIATKQAEAIVFAIQESRDTAVTKRDLDSNVALLRSEMEANTAALRSEIAAMGAELRAEMGKHRGELFRPYGYKEPDWLAFSSPPKSSDRPAFGRPLSSAARRTYQHWTGGDLR